MGFIQVLVTATTWMLFLGGFTISAAEPWTLRFTQEPADTQFAHTRNAVLNCVVAGNPKPSVTWRLARTNIVVTDVAGLRYVMENGSLVFPPFSREKLDPSIHQAGYQCLARNKIGAIISRAAKLRAVVVEPFRIYAMDHKVIGGNTAVIKAVVPSHVRQYVKVKAWHKGRNVITIGGRYFVMPSGDLVITNVRLDDTYQMYHWTAVHTLTQEMQASNPAKLVMIGKQHAQVDIQSRMTSDSLNLTVTTGQAAVLQCTAGGFPNPRYSWKKNGVPLNIMDRLAPFAGGSLRIERTEYSDQGMYTCEATNSGGTDSLSVFLKVLVPIVFKERPKPQAAQVGASRITMECEVEGEPKPNVTWYQNVEIEPVKRQKGRVSTRDHNLLIASVYGKDSGVYQCVADNGVQLEQTSAEFYASVILPKFTTSSKIVALSPGDRMQIFCAMSEGSSSGAIHWYHDGTMLRDGHGYAVTETNTKDSRLSKLTKFPVSLNDDGEYKCQVSNMAGSAEQIIEVHVAGGPNITYSLKEATGIQGQTISLPCRVKGFPLAKITWTKNGQRLLDQRKQVAKNGTLIIKNVQRGDKGKYICTAVNTKGNKDSADVMVNVFVSPAITPFKWAPVDEGIREFYTCVVAMGDMPVNITWYKDGSPLHSIPGGLEVLPSGYTSSINIPRVQEMHSGTYSCVVSNRAGVARHSAQIVVYVASKFLKDPEDQQVLKEHTAHLTCTTTGYPPARIEWSKSIGSSYVQLNNDARFSQLLNGTLVIRNVSKNDEGKYSCHAYNGVVGTPVSRQVSLVVHVPAAIVSPPSDRSAVVDGDVTFTCVAIGNLPITMTWHNGSKKLTFNERVQIGEHPVADAHMVNGTLRVSHLQLWDTRKFSCKVVNKFGKDKKSFQITAQERPSPPSKPAIDRVVAKSILLKWNPEFDGNSPITRYIIEFKPVDMDIAWVDATKVPAPGTARSYLLKNLKPATNYHVRLYAENAISMSNHGKDVMVRTREDAPSSPPQIVNMTAISSTEVYIEWLPPPKEHCNGIVRGYYISYSQINRPKNYHNITVSGGAIRSHVIFGLAKYKAYTIVIQAFTSAGPSPHTTKIPIRTQEDVPSKPPQFVEVTMVNSQSVSVKWKRPPYDSLHGRLQGYKVRYYKINDPENIHEVKVNSTILNITLRKLGKFTSYRVSVLAFTSKGDGVSSADVKVTTDEDIPGPPDNVRAIPVSRKKIRVRWSQPIEPNGIIRDYKLFFSTVINRPPINDTTINVYMFRTDGNRTSQKLENLESDTLYYFWVRASTSVGTGNASKVVQQRTVEEIVASIFDRKHPDTMAKWKTSAILNCEAYGDPEPTVLWYSRGKDLSDASKYLQFNNGSLKILRLEKSDTGDYMCTASNRLGKQTVLRKLKVQIPPSPPKDISFTSVNNLKDINITWSLGFDGYSPVTMFLLEYMTAKGVWKPVYLLRGRRHYVLHDINHTKSYFFRMSAINAVGPGRPNKILKVTFAAKGTIASVRQVDTVEEQARDGGGKKRFYNDPAILGILITISVLIVIVLLLLVACRVKRVSLKMPKDLKDLWDKAILGHPSQPSEESITNPIANGQVDINGDGIVTNSRSPSSDGHLADSSSSVEQMASNRGSLLSLPRSGSLIHHNVTHEPIMEEPYPPPPPPYHINSPMRCLGPPRTAHDDSMSDTSSEISFGGPVYHRPTLHDAEPISRARKIAASADPYQQHHPPIRSLNGTPGGILGMRGPADGGSELDNTSLALRGIESNTDLRKTFGSRLGRKAHGMSEETMRSFYARTPASGISRVPDSAFGSRLEMGRKSVASRRGSNASQKVAPMNRPIMAHADARIDTAPVSVRRDSESSKDSNSYPPEVEKAIAARDARAYDSTSSEYSSSRDELYSALEFGKRNNFEKYYGIPTLETTSMSSDATNSSEQDGICKFSASPRTVCDGFHAPTPIRQPPYNSRSRSRNNDAYLYVLDPRRRVMDGNVRVRSQLDHKGSLV